MEEWGVGERETWEPLWSARCSPATSSAGSLQDELDERSPPATAAENRVFVAVPEEVSDGRSTLLWALHNLVKDGSEVVIAHVHCPAPEIAQKRGHASMKPEEIKEYRKQKRAKAEISLDMYVHIAKCTREEVASLLLQPIASLLLQPIGTAHTNLLQNLQKRNWPHQNHCALCNGPLETGLYLSLLCPFAKAVWRLILSWEHFDAQLILPTHLKSW